jgi:prepilin-type N-terminal cleavage/methylation domain-containing protein
MAYLKNNSGFTLIELLIVAAILTVVMTILCVVFLIMFQGDYETGCYRTNNGTMASYETGLPCNWDCSYCMQPE